MTEVLPRRDASACRSYQPDIDGCGLEAELVRIEAQAALSWEEEEILLRRIGFGGRAAVIDLGCGPGSFAARLLDSFPVCTVVGVETHEGMAEAATRRLGGHPRFRLIRTSATQIGLAGGGFDVAVARFLLQHVEDPEKVVEETLRLLRPGGMLVVIDVDMEMWGIVSPRVSSLERVHARAAEIQRDRGGDRTIGRRLHRMLAEAGFEAPRLELYGYHSDRIGMGPFLAQLDPARLLPALQTGLISFSDYIRAAVEHERFAADETAFVMLAGFLAHGRKPELGDRPGTAQATEPRKSRTAAGRPFR